MFIKYIIYAVVMMVLGSGCVLIGYDSVADESIDGATDSSRDVMTEDARVIRDSMTRDSTTPDVMDASRDVSISDSAMDSSRKDAAESGVDSTIDDARTGD
jgi:hypothetical protein